MGTYYMSALRCDKKGPAIAIVQELEHSGEGPDPSDGQPPAKV